MVRNQPPFEESIAETYSARSRIIKPLAQSTAIFVFKKIKSCASENVNSL